MSENIMLNGVEINYDSYGEEPQAPAYKNSTYGLVSKVAYLIGVPKRIFENDYEPPKIEFYNRLDRDKNARIIRNLCIVRTAIERNFKKINDLMQFEYKALFAMPDLIPRESLQQLSDDGINFIKKSSVMLYQHIIEINRVISDRINNCKELFPLWISWDYIKDIFIMPNGFTEEGTKEAAETYYANRLSYPYQMYINWRPTDAGNILYNDKKFATLLYGLHGASFTEYSKVSDASSMVKNSI